MKVEHHPIVTYEERPLVPFTLDGLSLTGREGEPIAAALLANDIHIFRYTHKEHAPRGVFCGIGQCSDCVVIVNGVPNVRACVTPLAAGMRIERQHGHGQLGEKLT